MHIRSTTICGLMALTAMAGCVQPNVWHDSQLESLQRSILARSPQQRDPEGLGPMQPGPSVVPPVGVLKDLKSGKPVAKLTLQDVIVRSLANNTDIAVVAYNPQVSYQRVVQEAAQFDYTLFGGIGYSTVDDAWRHKTGRPIEKERTMSVGVRNRTPAGTEWSVTQEMVREWDNSATDSVSRWYRPSLNVDVTQPLLRNAWPGVNLAPLEIARLDYRISLSQFRSQVEATLVQTITTYYNLQRARTELDIVTQLLQQTQGTLERVRGRSELDATAVQIKQTESAVRTRQAAVVRAAKNVRDVQDALVRLIGDERLNLLQDDITVVPTTDMQAHAVRISAVDQLLTALVMNPDLEQARLAIRQGEINVRVAKNQTLPELNVSAGAEISGGAHSRHDARNEEFDGDYISYNAQLTFEYPIGNREREALLAQRRLEHHQAVSQMQTVADQIAQQVRERIRQVQTRYEDLELQRQAVAANRAELDGLEALERSTGKLTPEFLNLKLSAQEDLATARQAEIAALTEYNVALVELTQATGAVLELNQIRLALPKAGIEPTQAPLVPAAPMPSTRPAPSTTQPSAVPAKPSAPDTPAADEPVVPPAQLTPPATPPAPTTKPTPDTPTPPAEQPDRYQPRPLEQINITDS